MEIDWDESPREPENSEAIIVDEIKLNLTGQQMEQLRRNINPPKESNLFKKKSKTHLFLKKNMENVNWVKTVLPSDKD